MEYSIWHEIVATWSTPSGSRNKSSGALCISSTVDIVYNFMMHSILSYIFAIWSTLGDGLHAHDDVLYLDECHDHPNLPHLCFYDHLTRHSKKENKIYILRHTPVSTYMIRIYQ